MNRTLALVVSCALGGLASSTALAQLDACIVFTRIHRASNVSAGTSANLDRLPICINTHSDEWAGASIDVDHSIDETSSCNDRNGGSHAYAFARQTGRIEPLELVLGVTGHGNGSVDHFPTQQAAATGLATLEIAFDVLQPRGFELEGAVSASVAGYVAPSAAEAMISLTGPGIAYERAVQVSFDDHSPVAPVMLNGNLHAGSYVLRLRSRASGWNVPGNIGISNSAATLTLRLEPRPGPSNPRCPQDWNNDGLIDSRDFFAFLADFFAGEADFTGDCVTDSRDFFVFVQRFFVICG